MKEIRVKFFNISEIDEITLLTVEQAKKLPNHILRCNEWWWLQSPGNRSYKTAVVYRDGDINKRGYDVDYVSSAIRPAFRITNLKSEIWDKVIIGKTLCTVVDKDLVLADSFICKSTFDEKSNNWETSELKAFINSKRFISLL